MVITIIKHNHTSNNRNSNSSEDVRHPAQQAHHAPAERDLRGGVPGPYIVMCIIYLSIIYIYREREILSIHLSIHLFFSLSLSISTHYFMYNSLSLYIYIHISRGQYYNPQDLETFFRLTGVRSRGSYSILG